MAIPAGNNWASRTFQTYTGYWIRMSWSGELHSNEDDRFGLNIRDSSARRTEIFEQEEADDGDQDTGEVDLVRVIRMAKDESGNVLQSVDESTSRLIPLQDFPTTRALFFCGAEQFDEIQIKTAWENNRTATMSIEYWDGDSWESVET